MSKLRAGILGATGVVGQKYISLLENHPWFEVTYLAASENSAGKTYGEAVSGKWCESLNTPERIAELSVHSVSNIGRAFEECDFVFSAVDSKTALDYEHQYAAAGIPVVSNVSAHRWDDDVPILIPEINMNHCDVIPDQQKNRRWEKGFIVTKSNCSLQSYLIPLYALHAEFGIKRVIVTTLQAVSGAGYPGHSSLDMIDNIVPYINGEEEKTEREPLKILGEISGDRILSADDFKISAHCNRVPVVDGHTACVSVEFSKKPEYNDIRDCWNNFQPGEPYSDLPSAPEKLIVYREEADRPQPKRDRNEGNGMSVTVGRLRECNILHWRFTGLSHNMVRGAVGGGVLNAELLKLNGYM